MKSHHQTTTNHQIDRIVAAICKMEPTEKILEAVWPWNYGDGHSVHKTSYGYHKIDLLMFTGESYNLETGTYDDWNELVQPSMEPVALYKAIPSMHNAAVLRVIEFEDESLWEIMTDFTPSSSIDTLNHIYEWKDRTRQAEALKYVPASCKKGYFLRKLVGHHLQLHKERLLIKDTTNNGRTTHSSR